MSLPEQACNHPFLYHMYDDASKHHLFTWPTYLESLTASVTRVTPVRRLRLAYGVTLDSPCSTVFLIHSLASFILHDDRFKLSCFAPSTPRITPHSSSLPCLTLRSPTIKPLVVLVGNHEQRPWSSLVEYVGSISVLRCLRLFKVKHPCHPL
jgi:hypothetical protein